MLNRFLTRLFGEGSAGLERSEVLGIPVVVENTRPDINTSDVITRLEASLALIRQYVPHHFWHLRHDFNHVIVKRFACRGAYFYDQRACLVELTFCVNPDFSDAQRAATINRSDSAGGQRSSSVGSFPMASESWREPRRLPSYRMRTLRPRLIRRSQLSESPKSTAPRSKIACNDLRGPRDSELT